MADALRRFASYDRAALARHPGVEDCECGLQTHFLGETVLADPDSGTVTVGGKTADFGQTLAILDWLCDGDPQAVASGEYCTVSSLPGVLVSGSGLAMRGGALTQKIHENPDSFHRLCRNIGAEPIPMGEIGYRFPVFPGIGVCLKFYFGDEEFEPQLTFLWDKNILQFVRYETVYYIAGCLRNRLQQLL